MGFFGGVAAEEEGEGFENNATLREDGACPMAQQNKNRWPRKDIITMGDDQTVRSMYTNQKSAIESVHLSFHSSTNRGHSPLHQQAAPESQTHFIVVSKY